MGKLGVHVSSGDRRGFGEMLARCSAGGSPIPVIFSVDQDVWPDVEHYSPQTVVVFRHKNTDQTVGGGDGPGDVYVGDPVLSAQRWMAAQMPSWRQNRAHYYAPLNEQDPPTLAAFGWLNTFTLECMVIAEANGFKLALYAFSAGNPKDLLDPVTHEVIATPEQCWAKLVPSLQYAKTHGHILILHEYGFGSPAANGGPATSLRASAPHLALRYRRAYQFLHPFNADPLLVIGEASAGVGGFGGIGEAVWLEDAKWYDSELRRDAVVVGCCLYQAGGDENIRDALPELGDYVSITPNGEPEGDPVIGIEPVDPPPIEGCRGKPRIQFEKKTVLFPATAKYGDSWYAAVGAAGLDVTKSADVAGLGDLDVRKVIAVNPNEWPGNLTEWFAEYYPGVQVSSLTVPTPGALKRSLVIDDIPIEEIVESLSVPYLNQLDGTDADYAKGDCGPACLAMALNYFQKPVTVDQVSQATGLGAGFLFVGWGNLDMAARRFGYSVTNTIGNSGTQIKASIDAGKPIVALINYAKLPAKAKYDQDYASGHFLVIVGYTEQSVIYHDPYWHNQDGKNRRLTWAEFDLAWSTPNADFSYLRQLGKIAPYVATVPAAKVGLHDIGGAGWMKDNGKQGIALDHVRVTNQAVALDYTAFANAGIQIIVRLNYGYADGTGTLPPASQLPAFEAACVATMKASKGVTAFQYGNEVNNQSEWPAGEPITVAGYINSYNRVWAAIPTTVKLGPSAIDPYYGPGSNNRDWWMTILNGISGADALFLHPKTQSNDPAEVDSYVKFSDDPLKWQYLHFRTIETSLEVAPTRFKALPVYLGEVNPQRITATTLGWLPTSTEWIRRAKAHVETWNSVAGHQPITGMVFYRWADDDWRLSNKSALLTEIFA